MESSGGRIATFVEKFNMEPLEQTLMRLIKASPSRIGSFRQLSRELDMGPDGRREVRAVLNGMVKAGVLLKLKGNRYTVPGKQSLVTGRISIHRDGYGFVIPDKRPTRLEGDVFIPARHLGEAMQGDSVLASLDRRPGGNRAEGRILKILQRRNKTVVGQFRQDRPFHRVVPHDFRIGQDVLIREGDQGEAVDGKIVHVEVTRFPSGLGQPLRGRVIEVLGSPGDMGVDIEIMVRKHQIPVAFPPLGPGRGPCRKLADSTERVRPAHRLSPPAGGHHRRRNGQGLR